MVGAPSVSFFSRSVGFCDVAHCSISIQCALRRRKMSLVASRASPRAHLGPLSQNIAAARLLLTRDDVDARLKDHEGASEKLLNVLRMKLTSSYTQASPPSTSTTSPWTAPIPPTPLPPPIPAVSSSIPGARTATMSSDFRAMAIEPSPNECSSRGRRAGRD